MNMEHLWRQVTGSEWAELAKNAAIWVSDGKNIGVVPAKPNKSYIL
jgi:hypothetical protein